MHEGNSTLAAAPPVEEQRCVVKLGWLWIDSASFRCAFYAVLFVAPVLTEHSLYVNSISVALQALTVISMGNIADHRAFELIWRS